MESILSLGVFLIPIIAIIVGGVDRELLRSDPEASGAHREDRARHPSRRAWSTAKVTRGIDRNDD